jgi:hypothetical protein
LLPYHKDDRVEEGWFVTPYDLEMMLKDAFESARKTKFIWYVHDTFDAWVAQRRSFRCALADVMQQEQKLIGGEMALLIESMTKFHTTQWEIRVWRQEGIEFDHTTGTNSDLLEILADAEGLTARAIVDRVMEIPRINAIEIIDRASKNGMVAYADWP